MYTASGKVLPRSSSTAAVRISRTSISCVAMATLAAPPLASADGPNSFRAAEQGCNAARKLNVGRCGDGVLDDLEGYTEECDDGSMNVEAGQAKHEQCTVECTWAICGDGVVNAGNNDDTLEDGEEECDEGAANNLSPAEAESARDGGECTNECRKARCGDGVINENEECDDGNETPMDGCEPETCTVTVCEPSDECGSGVVCGSEVCDDGNVDDGDGCPSGPLGQCRGEATCGDGILWVGEEDCDDGNMMDGDGCEMDCTPSPAVCGNGVVEGGEQCDDGNLVDTDSCRDTCVNAACGDGVVWAGTEACDDGNLTNGDGCEDDCTPTCVAVCGDGMVDCTEACDDGNMDNTDGCVGDCELARCGDGFVQAGVEECDDGDLMDQDECSDDCILPRWVFITSTAAGPNDTGNLGGVGGADAECQERADEAGLGGTYMAWLTGSDPMSAPATRFGSQGFAGWYLQPSMPPIPVAKGWADLVGPNDDEPQNYLQAAIVHDENGADVVIARAWTNTKTDGTQFGSEHCSDWTVVNSTGRAGRALVDLNGSSWTDDSTITCDLGLRLYCFQVGGP